MVNVSGRVSDTYQKIAEVVYLKLEIFSIKFVDLQWADGYNKIKVAASPSGAVSKEVDGLAMVFFFVCTPLKMAGHIWLAERKSL